MCGPGSGCAVDNVTCDAGQCALAYTFTSGSTCCETCDARLRSGRLSGAMDRVQRRMRARRVPHALLRALRARHHSPAGSPMPPLAPATAASYTVLSHGKERVLLRRRQGGGRSEAARSARRQGRRPRRDDVARPPGAARASRSRPRSAAPSTATGGKLPGRARAEVDGALARVEKRVGATLRRPEGAAPRQRALRRARVDARDDGHDPEPRPERRDRRRASPTQDEEPALRARRVSPLRRDVRRRRARRRTSEHVRARARRRARAASATAPRASTRRASTPRSCKRKVPDADMPGGRARRRSSRRSRRSSTTRRASDFPDDPREQLWGAIGAVFEIVEQPARQRLPQACTTSPRAGAPRATSRRWSSATSATTSAHRRRVHARPVDRRAPLLRRVAPERAGRGRRRRHPHAASAPREAAAGDDANVARGEDARRLRRARRDRTQKLEKHFRDMQDLEFTIQDGKLYMLQCRNGKRTGARRGAHRRRDGEGGPHQRATRRSCASTPASLDQLLHPTHRSRRAPKKLLARGLPASPGAASGHDRLQRRRGRAARRAGQGR